MVYGVKGLGKVQKDTNSVIMVIDSSGCFVDKSENSMYKLRRYCAVAFCPYIFFGILVVYLYDEYMNYNIRNKIKKDDFYLITLFT